MPAETGWLTWPGHYRRRKTCRRERKMTYGPWETSRIGANGGGAYRGSNSGGSRGRRRTGEGDWAAEASSSTWSSGELEGPHKGHGFASRSALAGAARHCEAVGAKRDEGGGWTREVDGGGLVCGGAAADGAVGRERARERSSGGGASPRDHEATGH